MKQFIFLITLSLMYCANLTAQTDTTHSSYYLDIHRLQPGKVKFADVADAHKKDLAIQRKFNVDFLKYWVDEKNGVVYCLSTALDSNKIRETHQQAHGLLPAEVLEVTEGEEGNAKGEGRYYIDVHELGAGNVKAADVAAAHEKDLKAQTKHGVNFINYWVDEKRGIVVCLSQAAKASDVVDTHKEAHGLLPVSIAPVKQGQ